jgi:hypothetical protein
MTEQVLFSTQGPICRHQQLARSCEWCEIERDRDQWRDRCQEAQVQAQAARAERDNARAEVTELRGTPVFRQLHQQCQQVERVVAERDAARAELTVTTGDYAALRAKADTLAIAYDAARAAVGDMREVLVLAGYAAATRESSVRDVRDLVADRDAARAEEARLAEWADRAVASCAKRGCDGWERRMRETDARAEQAEAEVARLKVALVQARLFVDTTALMAEDPFVKASAMKVRAQVDAALAAKAGACE